MTMFCLFSKLAYWTLSTVDLADVPSGSVIYSKIFYMGGIRVSSCSCVYTGSVDARRVVRKLHMSCAERKDTE